MWAEHTDLYEFDKAGRIVRALRRGFCAWHFECRQYRRLAAAYDEFELFVRGKRAHSCTQFSHHPTSYLWPVLHGEIRALAAREVVQPCPHDDCWVWDVLERDGRSLPWVPPEIPRSFNVLTHQLVRRLAAKMGASQ
jgi:hypothetical protein